MKRKKWEKRILNFLRENGPQPRQDLVNKLEVPDNEKRTFYRAVKDLKGLGVVEGEDVLYLHGQEEPSLVKIHAGPRLLRITIPLQRDPAKRLLKKRPLVRHAILRRKGIVYEILSELGFLEE